MNVAFYLKQAEELKAKLDEPRPLSPDTEAKIIQKLRLDWNFHSNHLEGNQLTYGETKALILHGLTAQGKPIKDHLETSGHDEAIFMVEDIVKNKHPLTERFIRELHVLILKEPNYKRSISADGKNVLARKINIGVYKTSPNHVKTATGETFYFASPEETPAKMHELIEWYRAQKEISEINPILLATQFHYKFIRIHPFDDGNGRIARLLMNFILMQFGYPPAIIKVQDKENYFSVLRQADAGNIEPFISYIAENVVYTLELMLKGANGEEIEEPDDLDIQIIRLKREMDKTYNPKIINTLNEDLIDVFFKSSLKNLLDKTIKINDKFHVFYEKHEYTLFYNWFPCEENYFDDRAYFTIKPDSYNDVLEIVIARVKKYVSIQNQTDISIHCNFYDDNIPQFNQNISLHFFSDEYQITVSQTNDKIKHHPLGLSINEVCKKTYKQKLTDEEIDYFLKKEAQKHLDFIEEKMKG